MKGEQEKQKNLPVPFQRDVGGEKGDLKKVMEDKREKYYD